MLKAEEAKKEIIVKEMLQWQKRDVSGNCGCANSLQNWGERKLNEWLTAGYSVREKSGLNNAGKGFS
jgi:hypothetical protein